MKGITRFGTALAILAGAAVLRAQDTPQETPGEGTQAEPEAAAQTPKSVLAELGWASWDVSGSRRRVSQYATPPSGLYLRSISWGPWLPNLKHGANLIALTPGEKDTRYGGDIYLNYGSTYVQAGGSRHQFNEVSQFPLQESEREFSGGLVRHLVTPNVAVQLNAQLDEQDKYYDGPLQPLHQRTRSYNAAIEGKVGSAHLGLGLTNWNYFDRTNVLFDTEANVWNLSYAQDLTPSLSLGGNLIRSKIDQGSGGESEIEALALSGSWDLSDATGLSLDFRRTEYDLPGVQSAFVRERSYGRARLSHRWNGWNFQLGYSKEDVERIRRDRTFIDTPSFHGFEAKASGRISPNSRLTFRGGRRSMDGRAGMLTNDTRALYWRNRTFFQTKLDVTTEQAFGYAVFSYREDKNDARSTSIRNHGLTLGGSVFIKPELEGYFEASTDNWSARSGDPEAAGIDRYFPDGSLYTVGLNWSLRSDVSAGLSYTEFGTSNDNPLGLRDQNVKGKFLTTSLRYRLPIGVDLGLTFAPWSHVDRAASQLSYRSTYITLTGGLRF